MGESTPDRPHADKRMPAEVKESLLDIVEGDPGLEDRVTRLTETQLAKSSPERESGYSTAQRFNATGVARKVLAQELALWEPPAVGR